MRVGQIFSDLIGDHLYLETRPARHFASLPSESGNQPKIIQHRGAQQQSHIAYHSDAGFCHAANGSKPLIAGFAVGRCLDPPQLNQHCRHRLAYFVVQLAREIAPLLLLRGDQPVGEFQKLTAGLFHLLIARLRFPFQTLDATDTDRTQNQAQNQSERRRCMATRRRKRDCTARMRSSPASRSRSFRVGDLPCQLDYFGAEGHDDVLQKASTLGPSYGCIPLQCGSQRLPIRFDPAAQILESRLFQCPVASARRCAGYRLSACGEAPVPPSGSPRARHQVRASSHAQR